MDRSWPQDARDDDEALLTLPPAQPKLQISCSAPVLGADESNHSQSHPRPPPASFSAPDVWQPMQATAPVSAQSAAPPPSSLLATVVGSGSFDLDDDFLEDLAFEAEVADFGPDLDCFLPEHGPGAFFSAPSTMTSLFQSHDSEAPDVGLGSSSLAPMLHNPQRTTCCEDEASADVKAAVRTKNGSLRSASSPSLNVHISKPTRRPPLSARSGETSSAASRPRNTTQLEPQPQQQPQALATLPAELLATAEEMSRNFIICRKGSKRGATHKYCALCKLFVGPKRKNERSNSFDHHFRLRKEKGRRECQLNGGGLHHREHDLQCLDVLLIEEDGAGGFLWRNQDALVPVEDNSYWVIHHKDSREVDCIVTKGGREACGGEHAPHHAGASPHSGVPPASPTSAFSTPPNASSSPAKSAAARTKPKAKKGPKSRTQEKHLGAPSTASSASSPSPAPHASGMRLAAVRPAPLWPPHTFGPPLSCASTTSSSHSSSCSSSASSSSPRSSLASSPPASPAAAAVASDAPCAASVKPASFPSSSAPAAAPRKPMRRRRRTSKGGSHASEATAAVQSILDSFAYKASAPLSHSSAPGAAATPSTFTLSHQYHRFPNHPPSVARGPSTVLAVDTTKLPREGFLTKEISGGMQHQWRPRVVGKQEVQDEQPPPQQEEQEDEEEGDDSGVKEHGLSFDESFCDTLFVDDETAAAAAHAAACLPASPPPSQAYPPLASTAPFSSCSGHKPAPPSALDSAMLMVKKKEEEGVWHALPTSGPSGGSWLENTPVQLELAEEVTQRLLAKARQRVSDLPRWMFDGMPGAGHNDDMLVFTGEVRFETSMGSFPSSQLSDGRRTVMFNNWVRSNGTWKLQVWAPALDKAILAARKQAGASRSSLPAVIIVEDEEHDGAALGDKEASRGHDRPAPIAAFSFTYHPPEHSRPRSSSHKKSKRRAKRVLDEPPSPPMLLV